MAAMTAPEATPAPTRRDRKKARTRRDIYEAAMRLFARRGFEAATIADICEAADVARGTFFLHFPSKAALLYEFNQQVAEDFRESLTEPRGSAHDELCALVERMSRELSARAEIMSAMVAAFYASPEAIAAAPEQETAIVDLVTEIIARGQACGEFSPRIDARLAAASFFATAGAFVSGYVLRECDLPPEEINRQFLQLTFGGLGCGLPPGDATGQEARRRRAAP